MSRISTKGLVKVYGGRCVVNKVEIEISKGEIVGLLGPNGAGKSTTFNMIVGLIKPTDGHIFFNDKEITGYPMHERARLGIGYLAQDMSIFRKLTVEQNIMAILETTRLTAQQQKDRLEFLLDELGVTKLRKSIAYTLSGGERRRVEIARALVNEPDFIMLDEPFSGVDPKAVEELQDIIYHMQGRGLGVLITDHNVRETLTVTDRSYIIHEGTVKIAGTAEQLVNSPEARKYYLGERFTMDTTQDERKLAARQKYRQNPPAASQSGPPAVPPQRQN
ncbi:MAG: LPS export ABC transporter ATP-binding protein [Candidatus Sumerlaeaceae bacterium]|nr:LPS export ABC transporter ATP-binding protein [Candidatus Sumerlaeaceae bacterium]